MPDQLCKLTGQPGKFVDSHIIPAALTRPSTKGSAWMQYGIGQMPVRRWSSWYDGRLVTEEGERYLSDLDSWAIENLRKNLLVWSGWGSRSSLGEHCFQIGEGIGARQVVGIDPRMLRLFFLSLLWRAAATELEEFSEVSLSDEALGQLREAIITGTPPPLCFYPCQLTQISTRGAVHNHTPIRDLKILPTDGALVPSRIPIPTFRFYFDGLIAHMHVSLPRGFGPPKLGNLLVGAGDTLVLSTVTFETSFQAENMDEAIRSYEHLSAPTPNPSFKRTPNGAA